MGFIIASGNILESFTARVILEVYDSESQKKSVEIQQIVTDINKKCCFLI